MTLQHPTDTLDIQALFPDGTHLIGGEFVPARSGETIPVINPATGQMWLRFREAARTTSPTR